MQGTDPDSRQATHQAIATAWRMERAKVVAAVARLSHDLDLAEECAQDALVAALEHWPREGLPANPAAWLTTTAKNRALDHLRHHSLRARKHQELAADFEAREALVVPDFVDALDAARRDTIGDDLLRLMFIACHPVLSTDARVALTLRLLGGLETGEIARAFLVPEPTIAQRIVRAKKTLGAAKLPFELPPQQELPARLASVLEVLYLIFNAGYVAQQRANQGSGWTRPALCSEALRLARVLAAVTADEPEVQGLLALLELQASRLPARSDAQGRAVLLPDQDRSRWDRLLLRHGLVALQHAEKQVSRLGTTPGPYLLQAAIAACHARAARAEDTDWRRIATLYGLLALAQPSPVIELNRAVAVGMADGPAAGLALLDGLAAETRLADYPWLHSVRGDLLHKLGRSQESCAAFGRAAELAHNDQDRELLLARAAQAAG